jgi:hypothetical protein
VLPLAARIHALEGEFDLYRVPDFLLAIRHDLGQRALALVGIGKAPNIRITDAGRPLDQTGPP